MRLIFPILINCLLVLAVYLADKYTPAKKLPYVTKQIIIGVLFGGVSAFASSYGVEWLGAVVNVRDAAPLSAGLYYLGCDRRLVPLVLGILGRWHLYATCVQYRYDPCGLYGGGAQKADV